jgi:hypothetical protein
VARAYLALALLLKGSAAAAASIVQATSATSGAKLSVNPRSTTRFNCSNGEPYYFATSS